MRPNRRTLKRTALALAAADVVYRMFVREPLRRSLGIETHHAPA